MEFPDLGQNCSHKACKQLDFLPMRCDACSKIFCKDHVMYSQHSCPESYKKDNQVPVCPLCNEPISVMKGEQPDLIVGRHIDNDCQSDTAKQKRKVYTNKCNKKGCKQKELVPVRCDKCHKNFCLRHRLETDHDCKGYENSGRGMSQAGAAAISRGSSGVPARKTFPKSSTQPPKNLTSIGRDLDQERRLRQQQMQGTMSEDEAMARAMAASMSDTQTKPTNVDPSKQAQEEADAALARALAASEQEARNNRRRPQQQPEKKDACNIS